MTFDLWLLTFKFGLTKEHARAKRTQPEPRCIRHSLLQVDRLVQLINETNEAALEFQLSKLIVCILQ